MTRLTPLAWRCFVFGWFAGPAIRTEFPAGEQWLILGRTFSAQLIAGVVNTDSRGSGSGTVARAVSVPCTDERPIRAHTFVDSEGLEQVGPREN